MKLFYVFLIPIIFLCFSCNPSDESEKTSKTEELLKNNIVPVSNAKGARKFQIGKVKGYRLQIYTTLDRTEALKYKSLFQNSFPDVAAYLVYEEPVYKVRVGDYLSKSEAKSFVPTLNKIKDLYGSFVIKCMVNYIIPERKDSLNNPKTNLDIPIEVTWTDSSRQSLDLITEEIMTKEDIERERKMQAEDKEEEKSKPTKEIEKKPETPKSDAPAERGVKVRGFVPNDSI
jgi:hypothetical protein